MTGIRSHRSKKLEEKRSRTEVIEQVLEKRRVPDAWT
jgi:hypothetical protein